VIEVNLYRISTSKSQGDNMTRFYDFIQSYVDFKDKNKISILIKGV